MHVQSMMWPDLVVLLQPDIDGDLSLFGCMKPFGVEDLAAERAVEALVVLVLPG